jgi:hypothetical protein
MLKAPKVVRFDAQWQCSLTADPFGLARSLLSLLPLFEVRARSGRCGMSGWRISSPGHRTAIHWTVAVNPVGGTGF